MTLTFTRSLLSYSCNKYRQCSQKQSSSIVRSYGMYTLFYNSSVTFFKTVFIATMINVQ